jgi:hypothetical protein
VFRSLELMSEKEFAHYLDEPQGGRLSRSTFDCLELQSCRKQHMVPRGQEMEIWWALATSKRLHKCINR